MKYKNPIITGFYPDPSIVRKDDEYYLVNSSFEYYPGVPLFKSKDLLNWNQHSYVLNRAEQLELQDTKPSGGIYAPTIRYEDGCFYLVTTNVSRGNLLVSTTDLENGWSDPLYLKDVRGLDPSLYFEQGKAYLQYAGFTDDFKTQVIRMVELDVTTGAFIGEDQIISYGCGGRDPEGPHIYKIGAYYYLICAEGGTREGHMVTLQRSTSLWGPYEAYVGNPILSNRNLTKGLQAVGHGDIVEDIDGNWWMVALAQREIKHKHILGRETILVPLTWNDDWFYVDGRIAKETIETSLIHVQQQEQHGFYDAFDQEQLGEHWCSLRTSIKERAQLQQQRLTLFGNSYTLQDIANPSFLCTRQKEWNGVFETKVSWIDCDECGLAIYMDPCHHMEFGFRKTNQGSQLFIRKNIGELQCITDEISLNTDEAVLRIVCDEDSYHFLYQLENTYIELGSTKCKHVATEVADSAFNGVMVGMYVYGDGKKGIFSYFQYAY